MPSPAGLQTNFRIQKRNSPRGGSSTKNFPEPTAKRQRKIASSEKLLIGPDDDEEDDLLADDEFQKIIPAKLSSGGEVRMGRGESLVRGEAKARKGGVDEKKN